ncbi:MAG: TRAP transporter TatT component family protein, partial [Elusimicrobiota bacterium]
REALPSQLKLLESLLESDPANPALLKSLSEGFTAYAFLFVEEERPERARELYRRALDYSLRLAGLDPALASLRTMTPDALDAALSRTTRRSVPGLYWSAYAWSAWANLAKDDPEALLGLPKAARLMKRVLDLDPDFQFGGADLWFGVYYSARPQIAGGDPAKSRAHFESSLGRSGGGFLLAKTLFAEWYAVAALDEELFRRLNSEVLAAAADALPQARLANEAAKRRSKRLLGNIHELF